LPQGGDIYLIAICFNDFQVACSLDPEGRLTFKGRFTPKQIESVVKKYMLAYVQCQMCKSFDTNLVKDSTTRLTFIECNCCQVQRAYT
jgi:translation initiation factor 2 subunit 2